MQTKDVINACQELASAGKKPTIALVKTRLTTKVPLATIVSGIKLFQSNIAHVQTEHDAVEVNEKHLETRLERSDKCTCADRLAIVEKQLIIMASHITSLQAQVKGLTER